MLKKKAEKPTHSHIHTRTHTLQVTSFAGLEKPEEERPKLYPPREQPFSGTWDVMHTRDLSYHSSIMINTYQTSLAPPPVPPRHSRPQSVLVPMPLPSQGRGKPLLLVTLMLLQFLLTVGGFAYLYYNSKLVNNLQDEHLTRESLVL